MIYAGMIFGWFGHFITESFPNLLAVAKAKEAYPEAHILAHAHGGIEPASWRVRHAAHLEYFCAQLALDPDELTFALAPTRVRQLIIPETAFTGKFRYSPWVSDAIDALWPAPDDGGLLYLSRRRIPRARLRNEEEIEAAVCSAGFDVVHLQEHPLDEQISLVRNARMIVGPQGSALHWSLYAPKCRTVVSLGSGSPLQRGICRLRGQNLVELRGQRAGKPTARHRRVPVSELQQILCRAT